MSLKTIPIQVVGKDIIAGSTTSASGAAYTPAFRLTFNDEWDNLTGIIAKFTDARGDGGVTVEVTDLALDGNREVTVEVPAAAMAFEGMAELTIVGTKIETRTINGVETEVVVERMTTKPYQFRVYESHWDRTASNVEDITSTDKEQIMARVDVAEQYAKGTREGVPVAEGQAGYHDNALYYKDLAETAQGAAETAKNAAAAQASNALGFAQRAEAAQGAAETAQGKAEAAQTAAEAAQAAAEGAAEAASEAAGAADSAAENAAASAEAADTSAQEAASAAETAATDAVAAVAAQMQEYVESASEDASAAQGYAGEAEQSATAAAASENAASSAKTAAQAAQSYAESAASAAQISKTAAETAQGKAETAKTAAQAAQSAAETAQGIAEGAATDAESAQYAAQSAQGAAETAQAAAEAAAAQAATAIYAAFVTEGVASSLGYRTALGADGIPAKTATVTQTSGTVPQDWTIRRTGKNHFDRDTVEFKIGYLINSSGGESEGSSYMYTTTFIPVLPDTEYVFSGIYPPGSTGTSAPVSCYRADKSFIERKTMPTSATNPQFKTPSDCRFIRFNCPVARVGGAAMYNGTKIAGDIDIQIEIGTVATEYAAYSAQDYTVPVTSLLTPTAPAETPTTLLGENVFLLLAQADAAATMDITARLDPTLVYNYLKAAIVAAGAI